jgi:hypothetical protein
MHRDTPPSSSIRRAWLVVLVAAASVGCARANGSAAAAAAAISSSFPAGYRCVPFRDARHAGGPQTIPGRLQNEYYDMLDVSDADKRGGAGEGACYHDTDNKNSGSGAGSLNGVGTYENEFRMFESPDISYVKLHHAGVAIDDSPYNLVAPDSNALYLGWIAPGEWVRYTVNVTRAGWYSITTAYTSKFGGHVSLDLNGKDATGPLAIPPTFAAADTIEWRQAHHWNRVAGLGRLHLPAGRQLLTLHFIDQPVMNFDWMEFVPVP